MIRQWTFKESLILSIGNCLDGGSAVLHNFERVPPKEKFGFI